MLTDASPIVTARLGVPNSWTLKAYLETGGYEGLRKALSMTPEAVSAEVMTANLLGRGGAGFEVGRKWSMLAKPRPAYLVINGDESEPCTYKDHMLLEADPHQIIEGTLICAYATGAAQAFIFVRGEFALGIERITAALNEAYAYGAVGRDILGSGWSVDLVIHPGAGAYICGEETALLESLEGKRGYPRDKPPYFPAVKGLYMQPTIVNNVESVSNLPWIVLNGGEGFKSLGLGRSTGTRIFSLSGHVRQPANYEIEMSKTTFQDLIYDPKLGGGIRNDNQLKAFIPGGASAPWFGPTRSGWRSTRTRWARPAPCSGRDRSSSWTTPRAWCGRRGGSPASSTGNRAVSAPPAGRVEGGSTRSSTASNWAQDGSPTSTFSSTCATTSLPVCHGRRKRPRSASSARRSRPPSPRPSGCSGTSSSSTSRKAAVRLPDGVAQVDTFTITVDGKAIEARKGEMLIAAAERGGVYIPRFCWHPRLRPVGMCRMCLVEVKNPRGWGLAPACYVPVADGQEAITTSPKVKKAQDGVLEFLLINHPLDCPVCDRGGECPLQDQTFAFGPGESRMIEEKRHWEKPIPINPLVALDRERCIQCARCTRFADEVAGDAGIDFIGRADGTEVNTFPTAPFTSNFSANIVQICPVGALTATPYRFKARPWDLEVVESTCTFCSVGCRIAVQSTQNDLVRHLGIDSDPVNHGWLCDKGRFGYEALESEARLANPMVRAADGTLTDASWTLALQAAADGLRRIVDTSGAGAVAVLGGARLANEDAYAWARLAKAVLGTDNVDCQLGDGLPAEVVLGLPQATIDEACRASAILLLGPDLKEELPVLYLRLREAVVDKGVPLVELVPAGTGLTRHAAVSLKHRPGEAAAVAGPWRGSSPGPGSRPRARAACLAPTSSGPPRSLTSRASSSCSAARRWPSRPRPPSTPPACWPRACPACASSPPSAGPTCGAPSTWASPPGSSPVGCRSTTAGRGSPTPPPGARCPAPGASTPRPSSRPRSTTTSTP